jgi:hypothetical protein
LEEKRKIVNEEIKVIKEGKTENERRTDGCQKVGSDGYREGKDDCIDSDGGGKGEGGKKISG